jgi:serine/threonine protein kinase
MPIQINASTRLQANQAGFDQSLKKDINKSGTDAKATLRQLDSYIRDGSGRLHTGDIRIVNTTNNKNLAFSFKSFGWDQQYRKDRTAQALIVLLEKAGVSDAKKRVDTLLMEQGSQTYSRLSAGKLDKLLSAGDIQAKIGRPTEQVQRHLEKQDIKFNPAAYGKGGYGTTYLAKQGKNEQIVKLFTKGNEFDAQPLTGKRDIDQKSELYASYLTKSRDPNWQKPLIIAPSAYIVSQDNDAGLETIPVKDVKQRVKDAKGGLSCVGLVMNKAPGTNVNDLSFKPGDANSVKMARSGLQTLRALNERGFIHRDIKPENMSYDDQKGELHFFDTGLMFKSRKPATDRPDAKTIAKFGHLLMKFVDGADATAEAALPTKIAGTSGYTHPAVAQGDRYGSQADLHSFGISMLQKTYPGLSTFALIPKRGVDDEEGPKYITASELMPRLEELGKEDARATPAAKADARKFMQDVKNPNSYANFIMDCLNKADTTQISAGRWANRTYSNQQLEELMKHSALRQEGVPNFV